MELQNATLKDLIEELQRRKVTLRVEIDGEQIGTMHNNIDVLTVMTHVGALIQLAKTLQPYDGTGQGR